MCVYLQLNIEVLDLRSDTNITTTITTITGRLPWQPAGIKFTQCVSGLIDLIDLIYHFEEGY